MLALARLLVEIGAREQVADVEPHRVEETPRQILERLAREPRIEVHALGGGLLKERIAVVPGPQLGARHPEAAAQPLVEVALVGLVERAGAALDLVEPGEELRLLDLVPELERHPVVIGEPELARRLVAQPHQLEQLGLDLGADLLRGLPRAPPPREVVRFAQQLADGVVADALAIERGAVGVEAALELLLHRDDALDGRGRELVRLEAVERELALALEERVAPAAFGDRGAQQRERLGASIDFADRGLEARALLLVRRVARDVRVPHREVEAQLERLDLGDQPRDQIGERGLRIGLGCPGRAHAAAE